MCSLFYCWVIIIKIYFLFLDYNRSISLKRTADSAMRPELGNRITVGL
jgi:hypothetical protein